MNTHSLHFNGSGHLSNPESASVPGSGDAAISETKSKIAHSFWKVNFAYVKTTSSVRLGGASQARTTLDLGWAFSWVAAVCHDTNLRQLKKCVF